MLSNTWLNVPTKKLLFAGKVEINLVKLCACFFLSFAKKRGEEFAAKGIGWSINLTWNERTF